LCQTEFTKALRLYRIVLSQNRARELCDENMYFSLIQACIRVGCPDVCDGILKTIRRNSMECSASFYCSLMKLLSAKHYYSHCLMVWNILGPCIPEDKTVYSCVSFAALECEQWDIAMDMGERLCKIHSTKDVKQFIHFFRTFSKTREGALAEKMLRCMIRYQIPTPTVILNMVCAACANSHDMAQAWALLVEFSGPKDRDKDSETNMGGVSSTTTTASASAATSECGHSDTTESTSHAILPSSTMKEYSSEDENCVGVEKAEADSVSTETNKSVGGDIDDEFSSSATHGSSVLPVADVVTYNTVIRGYVQIKELGLALKAFKHMKKAGVNPDDVTYGTLLDGCVASKDMSIARPVLDSFEKSGCKMNTVLYTTFIKGLVRSQMVDRAIQLYESMKMNGKMSRPDLITYSVLIKATCDKGDIKTAVYLLRDMQAGGYQPDDIVLSHLLIGCCNTTNIALGSQLFCELTVPRGRIGPSPYTLAAMVKLYGKCGELDNAFALVRSMETRFRVKPSVVIVTCLMSGCLRNQAWKEAVSAFEMLSEYRIEPDQTSFQILIQGLISRNKPVLALNLLLTHGKTTSRLPYDSVNQLLAVVSSRGLHEESRKLRSFMIFKQVPITMPHAHLNANALAHLNANAHIHQHLGERSRSHY